MDGAAVAFVAVLLWLLLVAVMIFVLAVAIMLICHAVWKLREGRWEHDD